jgi:DNA polymerase-3 subunit delta
LKISADNLAAQLATRLLPVYVVSGDDPLLTGEAADAVRAAARAAGYTEREVFFVERGGASWDDVLRSAEALSLFASRRVVEVRMPSGKPGSGAAALTRVLDAAGADLLLLVLTERLDKSAQNAEWLEQAQQRGAWVPVWPVDLARFPGWLRARARTAGLTLDDAAVALLAERTEGNLLAAKQELDKLVLLLGNGARVGAAEVAAGSSDSARFNVFQLGDAVGSGEAARALRILDGLRSEGGEAVLVLWALIRALGQLEAQSAAGQLRRRLSWPRLVARAARADRMAKGMLRGEVWDELTLLVAELCGQRTVPLSRWQLRMQGGT